MPQTKGTNIFLGAIVVIATLCSLYNLAFIPSEQQALRRFQQDPSCHPAIEHNAISGECQFELDTLIHDPQAVMGRSGPSYLLSLRTPTGTITTAHAYTSINDQLRQGTHSVGRLIYNDQVVAIYAGPASQHTLVYPSLSLAGRYFNAGFSAAIALLFAVPLVIRARQRVQKTGSECTFRRK